MPTFSAQTHSNELPANWKLRPESYCQAPPTSYSMSMHERSLNSNITWRAFMTSERSVGSVGLSQPKPRTVASNWTLLSLRSVTMTSVHG